MAIWRAAAVLILSALLVPGGTVLADSTINTTLPVQGAPYNAAPIRQNFGAAANDINALQRLNAGDTAPFPSSEKLGNLWLDTSAPPYYVLRIWSNSGNQWVPVSTFNAVTSQWIPPVGGGTIPSIVSAATTNLGSVAQAAVNVTGNQSIASFGTVAEGQVKVITFLGSPTLIYNSTFMILPGGANLTPAPGTMMIAVSLGSGKWRLMATGDVAACSLFTDTEAGCVPASGGGTTNFLRADGTWASPAITVPDADLLGGSGGSFTVVTVGSQLLLSSGTLSAPIFTDVTAGTVPQSGGGTVNFLRADGTWAPTAACSSITATAVLYSNGTTCVGDATHFFWTVTDNISTPYNLTISTNDTTGVNGAIGLNVYGANTSRGGAIRSGETVGGGSIRVGYSDFYGQGYVSARNNAGNTIMPLALNDGGAVVSIGTILQGLVNDGGAARALVLNSVTSSAWSEIWGVGNDMRGGVFHNASGKTSINLYNTGGSQQVRISADNTESNFVPGPFSASDLTTTGVLSCSGTNSAVQTNGSGKLVCGSISGGGGGITALTGDVTATGPGSVAATIANNAVTNAKAAQMAADTMKGNWTGSTANAADNAMPSCADSGGNHLNYVSGTGITCGTSSSSSGTVTSVALSVPSSSIFGVTGSPVTTTGTLGLTTTGTSGGIPYFSSGTQLSSSGALTNHALVVGGGAGATPATIAAMTDGQLAIGSTGANPVPATITAGSGITVTNGAGSITLSSTGSGGGASGLWTQVLSATPTGSSTGLSSWVNQGSAAVSDASTGYYFSAPSNSSGNNVRGRTKSSPGTPYTITMLMAFAPWPQTEFSNCMFGWYDGTKFQVLEQNQRNTGGAPQIHVNTYNSTTSGVSSQQFSGVSTWVGSYLAWYRIGDDGTTVSFQWSQDAVNYHTVYSIAKASGTLANYNTVFFGSNPFNAAVKCTILSWAQA